MQRGPVGKARELRHKKTFSLEFGNESKNSTGQDRLVIPVASREARGVGRESFHAS